MKTVEEVLELVRRDIKEKRENLLLRESARELCGCLQSEAKEAKIYLYVRTVAGTVRFTDSGFIVPGQYSVKSGLAQMQKEAYEMVLQSCISLLREETLVSVG